MGGSSKRGGTSPNGQPIALTIAEAAELSATSKSTIYEALQSRHLVGKKLGRKTIILREDLEHFLTSLPKFGDGDRANG
jgi:excisionase family DNA binding protein